VNGQMGCMGKRRLITESGLFLYREGLRMVDKEDSFFDHIKNEVNQ